VLECIHVTEVMALLVGKPRDVKTLVAVQWPLLTCWGEKFKVLKMRMLTWRSAAQLSFSSLAAHLIRWRHSFSLTKWLNQSGFHLTQKLAFVSATLC